MIKQTERENVEAKVENAVLQNPRMSQAERDHSEASGPTSQLQEDYPRAQECVQRGLECLHSS